MKKKLIALAVAGAMTAPMAAMADVKISGGLQAELTSLSGDNVNEGLYMTDGQEGGTPNAGNYGFLKFSAAEDLGNGMKALAMYNFNIQADNNNPGRREGYVGLTGGFGTVLAGRMSTPYKAATVSWDPFLTTSAQARGNYGMSTLHNGYVSNALAYANSFGGVNVKAALVVDEGVDAANRETFGNHAMSFSVNMPVGPVELAVAHIDASEMGGGADDAAATKIGVKYATGAFSVAGQYEMLDEGMGDMDIMYINGTYTMGANTIAAAYGQQEVDGSSTTQTYMSLGMVHSFSKKVRAHVAYIGLDHDGSDDSGIAAGLRVSF